MRRWAGFGRLTFSFAPATASSRLARMPIRHPMYSAIVGWLISLGLVDANWIPLVFAALSATNFLLRIRGEEQMMLQESDDTLRT